MLFDNGWAVDQGGIVLEYIDGKGEISRPQALQDVNRIPQNTPSFQTKQSDGTEILLYPDGTGKILIPDGPVVDVNADGTSVARQSGPDGFTANFHPQNGVVVENDRGGNIRLNLEELEELENLAEAGLFDSPEIFSQLVSGIQSSLDRPNAEGYNAEGQLNEDYMVEMRSQDEQDAAEQSDQEYSPVKEKILQRIGSHLMDAYHWVRNTCKLRARKNLPFAPGCDKAGFSEKAGFRSSPMRSIPATSSHGGQLSPQSLLAFNSGEKSGEGNFDSPYFVHPLRGHQFTFQDKEESGSLGGEAEKEFDEVRMNLNPNLQGAVNILNILDRKKDPSEFTFKADNGLQTLDDIYEENLEASFSDIELEKETSDHGS